MRFGARRERERGEGKSGNDNGSVHDMGCMESCRGDGEPWNDSNNNNNNNNQCQQHEQEQQ